VLVTEIASVFNVSELARGGRTAETLVSSASTLRTTPSRFESRALWSRRREQTSITLGGPVASLEVDQAWGGFVR